MILCDSQEDEHTMIHLFPSSSFLGGFLVRMLSGLGFVGGEDLVELWLLLLIGTGAAALKEGFLCVCCEGSTFLRPEVTASPLLSE
jgi:hypothetical protein